MLLGDPCTYVIINITVYLMLLLLTVFRIKDMFKKHLKNVFLTELLLLLILAFILIFTPDTYIGSKISVIGSTWSVIIGIGIGPEKHKSVDPYAVPHILTDVIKVSAGWYNQQSVSQGFLRFCCFHSISQDYFTYLAWANILHQYLRTFIVSFTDEGRCRYWNVKTLTRSSEQVLCHFQWASLWDLTFCCFKLHVRGRESLWKHQ